LLPPKKAAAPKFSFGKKPAPAAKAAPTKAVGKTASKAKTATKAVAAPKKAAAPKFSFGKKAAPAAKAAPTKAVAAPKKAAPKFSFGKKPAAKAAPTKTVAPKKTATKKVAAKAKAPPKKAAPKKTATKKVVAKPAAKKAAPKKKSRAASSGVAESQGYPSFDFTTFKPFSKISGGGNRAPTFKPLVVPNLADPKLQIKRDPAFYAAAAANRATSLYGSDFAYDDGLTIIERKQRTISPAALTGSAKDTADATLIDTSIQAVDFFGLSADRFQLLFITVFGLFTLVGCLSGRLQL